MYTLKPNTEIFLKKQFSLSLSKSVPEKIKSKFHFVAILPAVFAVFRDTHSETSILQRLQLRPPSDNVYLISIGEDAQENNFIIQYKCKFDKDKEILKTMANAHNGRLKYVEWT